MRSLEQRVAELLAANNRLVERARTAEADAQRGRVVLEQAVELLEEINDRFAAEVSILIEGRRIFDDEEDRVLWERAHTLRVMAYGGGIIKTKGND